MLVFRQLSQVTVMSDADAVIFGVSTSPVPPFSHPGVGGMGAAEGIPSGPESDDGKQSLE